MADDVRGVLSVTFGSLVIALGSTVAGISAFDGEVELVVTGFVVFVAGYAFSQHGLHASSAVRAVTDDSGSLVSLAFQVGMLMVGVAFIGLGVTMFSQTILNPNLIDAALSGISSIGGYMCAHVGINRDGLGESLVYHPVKTLGELLQSWSNR